IFLLQKLNDCFGEAREHDLFLSSEESRTTVIVSKRQLYCDSFPKGEGEWKAGEKTRRAARAGATLTDRTGRNLRVSGQSFRPHARRCSAKAERMGIGANFRRPERALRFSPEFSAGNSVPMDSSALCWKALRLLDASLGLPSQPSWRRPAEQSIIVPIARTCLASRTKGRNRPTKTGLFFG